MDKIIIQSHYTNFKYKIIKYYYSYLLDEKNNLRESTQTLVDLLEDYNTKLEERNTSQTSVASYNLDYEQKNNEQMKQNS